MYEVHATFNIPVLTTDIRDFTHRKASDRYHQLYVTGKVYDFLKIHLIDVLHCDIPDDFELELSEIIYNSYDAYAKNGLSLGNALQISIDVEEAEENIIVKIRDNAGGFKHSKLDNSFTLQDITLDNKSNRCYSGGKGRGLIEFSEMLKTKNIGLFFSNVPEPMPGAVIKLEFPKPQRQCSVNSLLCGG